MALLLDRYIEATPGTCGGKPRISGRRITIADIVIMHLRMGRSVEEVAEAYDLPLASVYAALTYYHDHRDEIDKSIEEDEAFVAAFRRRNASPLREKLKALKRG